MPIKYRGLQGLLKVQGLMALNAIQGLRAEIFHGLFNNTERVFGHKAAQYIAPLMFLTGRTLLRRYGLIALCLGLPLLAACTSSEAVDPLGLSTDDMPEYPPTDTPTITTCEDPIEIQGATLFDCSAKHDFNPLVAEEKLAAFLQQLNGTTSFTTHDVITLPTGQTVQSDIPNNIVHPQVTDWSIVLTDDNGTVPESLAGGLGNIQAEPGLHLNIGGEQGGAFTKWGDVSDDFTTTNGSITVINPIGDPGVNNALFLTEACQANAYALPDFRPLEPPLNELLDQQTNQQIKDAMLAWMNDVLPTNIFLANQEVFCNHAGHLAALGGVMEIKIDGGLSLIPDLTIPIQFGEIKVNMTSTTPIMPYMFNNGGSMIVPQE